MAKWPNNSTIAQNLSYIFDLSMVYSVLLAYKRITLRPHKLRIIYRAIWPERNCPGDVSLSHGMWVQWVPSAPVHWLFSRQKLWLYIQRAGYYKHKVGYDMCCRCYNRTSARWDVISYIICIFSNNIDESSIISAEEAHTICEMRDRRRL